VWKHKPVAQNGGFSGATAVPGKEEHENGPLAYRWRNVLIEATEGR